MSDIREGLKLLRESNFARGFFAYFVSFSGTAMAPIAMAFGVLWYTTLHKLIPGHLLSRVSAYDHLGSIGLAPLGIVAGGFLYETIGATPTLLAAAATIIVPTLIALLVPAVRKLEVD